MTRRHFKSQSARNYTYKHTGFINKNNNRLFWLPNSKLTRVNIQILFQAEFVDKNFRPLLPNGQRNFIYRHFHFLDFESLGMRNPIYFNVVRDPVSHFISTYYFNRRHARAFGKKYYLEDLGKQMPDIYPQKENFKKWVVRPLDDCLGNNFTECRFVEGQRRITPVVSYKKTFSKKFLNLL